MSCKKVLYILMASVIVTMLSSGSLYSQKQVVIRGELQIERPYWTPDTVRLYEVERGALNVMQATAVGEDSKFGFQFTPPRHGFYIVGWGTTPDPKNKHKFYFEGGETLDVLFQALVYELIGDENSKENRVLYEWDRHSFELSRAALYTSRNTYKEFFPLLDEFAAQNLDWYTGRETGNERFDKLMQRVVPLDIASWALTFVSMPNSIHPALEDFKDTYYTKIDIAEMTADQTLLYMPLGLRTINAMLTLPLRLGQSGQFFEIDQALPILKHDGLKNAYLMGRSATLSSGVEIDNFISKYGNYLVPKDFDKLAQMKSNYLERDRNMSEVNFTYESIDGKDVSLSDFIGKVVYIDIWATWCGPCMKEAPHLKKLADEYRDNQDVVFIGLSVDKVADKDKWAKTVAAEQLPGVQLFVGGNDKLPAQYDLQGIPRFILIDKGGNVVAGKAPRPSSGEVQKLINDLL